MSNLLNIAEQILGVEEVKLMLQVKDDLGRNIILVNSDHGNEELVKEVFEVLDTDNEIYHRAAAFNPASMLEALIKVMKVLQTEEERKKFLSMRGFERNVFHGAVTNQKHGKYCQLWSTSPDKFMDTHGYSENFPYFNLNYSLWKKLSNAEIIFTIFFMIFHSPRCDLN